MTSTYRLTIKARLFPARDYEVTTYRCKARSSEEAKTKAYKHYEKKGYIFVSIIGLE